MREHLFHRNGGWGYVIELPLDPGTGRRRQQRRSGFRSKQEASEQLVLALADRVHGRPIATAARQISVGELVCEWLEAARPALRPLTVEGYSNVIKNWIIPHFGAIKIKDVTPVQLETLYAKLSREGGKGGRPLAPRSVKFAHTVLSLSLD